MSKPQAAVFLAKVPKSFKPSHACTVPPEILGGKYLVRRLSLEQAVRMAEGYNRTHLPSEGTYRHKWAIALADLKKYYRPYNGQHVAAARKPEGGAQ